MPISILYYKYYCTMWLLTLGAHAQQELQYNILGLCVCLCVCVCVCGARAPVCVCLVYAY